ncbi:hypothetical protein PsAD2_01753 [Pseudovibrio axinellae]|uniref:N-acetyltransferase domain-containing protein n=1 Tax=Pseudovibrio axinellae TaxID=989403 RepID=A0A165Z3E9_9HYPH|nr:GNAT family N-acetyltransferase [Pseudovibrio axinellae]KZL19475.1 hypothetical protein PsAD2_01753 [Pseudovibrio axinellae]SEQ28297.1 Protein N-acetyltransferase, RimJ/RimL family [Pseudovibrio axinellae]
MTAIPTLETQRLILRPPCMEDWPDNLALMRSERSKFMGGPVPRYVAWGIFCHDIAQWSLMGHGALMIELKSTGSCIGQVAINHGPLFPEHELGWFLYEGQEGNGYATEAATALRGWGFDAFGLKTLVSYIDRKNQGSIRIAERLGGTLDHEAPREDPEDLAYRYSPV